MNNQKNIKICEQKLNSYMSDVKSQLEENVDDEYKKVHVTYRYSNRDIEENLEYFKDCMINDLSPYKALLFFWDYLYLKDNDTDEILG